MCLCSKMKVYIKTLTGKTIELDVAPEALVDQLKKVIFDI